MWVVKQKRFESLAQVPFQVAGEHAQEHMSAYMRFAVDINGLHLQPGGLDGAKGALDCGQRFVSCHCVMGVDGISRQRGSDHIDAIELSFIVDSLLISRPQQVAIGDGDVEVLFDFAAIGFASEPLNGAVAVGGI